MSADMGGTEIYEPLDSVIKNRKIDSDKSVKKVFLLTDGEVSSPDKVVELAKKAADSSNCRIHTFGVGSDCSVDLVSRVARAGRGTCSLVVENKDLRSIVVKALARADEPQYSHCKLTFSPSLDFPNSSLGSTNPSDGFEMFRNDAFIAYGILKVSEFEKLSV